MISPVRLTTIRRHKSPDRVSVRRGERRGLAAGRWSSVDAEIGIVGQRDELTRQHPSIACGETDAHRLAVSVPDVEADRGTVLVAML